MRRLFALIVGLMLLPTPVYGDDGIPPETVAAVKRATVFVRVEGANWKATGSGFVVVTDKDSVLIATNHHVISLPENEKKRLTPTELVKSLKVPTVTAVFDSGTKTEFSAKAEVIAADTYYDLAILRVTGLKNPPAPIDTTKASKPALTMGVYTFGFPFGEALSTNKGSPAITVGKGSVSSLRNDDTGELAVVQIDGSLNPGNSGGPVVDTKGQLVGIAVATIKNSQGIGFAVPSSELAKMMKGRVGGFHLVASKAGEGKLVVKAELGVIDPAAAVRGVTLHYLVVPPNGEKPKSGQMLEQQTGAKKIEMKVEGGIASGDLSLNTADGDLFVQAVPDGGAGLGGAQSRAYPLQTPKGSDPVALGKPPVEVPEEPAQTGSPTLNPGFGRPFTPFIPTMPALRPINPFPVPGFPAVPGFPNPIQPINPFPLPGMPALPGFPNPMRPITPIPPIRPIPPFPMRPISPIRP